MFMSYSNSVDDSLRDKLSDKDIKMRKQLPQISLSVIKLVYLLAN
jgi:hypothetical protein